MVCRYRHLMLNMVSILPHCKKDNKVESKATKGATMNELVELRSCSSCLFFEVIFFFLLVLVITLVCYFLNWVYRKITYFLISSKLLLKMKTINAPHAHRRCIRVATKYH